MVSKSQSKEAQVSKAQSKELAISKAKMNEDKVVQRKTSEMMRFASSAEKDPNSTTTFDEEPKSTPGINTMSHVVKRKIYKMAYVVEQGGKKMARTKELLQVTLGVDNCETKKGDYII
ncbi:unnamed protein product [Prunus brigantina]